jgi:hypothetical protein
MIHRCIILASVLALTSCRFNHHEQMQPHFPAPAWDCDCRTTYQLEFEGKYQGENQYMQNPSVNCSDSVSRFTIAGVTINDTIRLAPDSLHSPAFEIPLRDYNFNMNDPVRIVVEHYGCARPKMLHPLTCKPQ